MGDAAGHDLLASLKVRAGEVGLAALGVAPADPMDDVREVLEDRRRRGLDGGMQFTYRNPRRSTDPQRILSGARSLVVAAMAYGLPDAMAPAGDTEQEPDEAPTAVRPEVCRRPRGAVALYARRDYYGKLRSALGDLAALLAGSGWRAKVVVDDNALVDRAAAHKAGLGWFGKNCNILLPGHGSMFVLGSVVTDAPLPGADPVADGCAKCTRCQSGCPTGALVAPGVLDGSRCLAWLLQKPGEFPVEFREALGDRLYGCDDCQTVCPVNIRASRANAGQGAGGAEGACVVVASGPAQQVPGSESGGPELDDVDILGLLRASDADLIERFARWYIPKRDPRVLRRNALVVLGNTADGRSSEVGATLERYLASGDALLVSHAAWAAERLGRADLVQAVPAQQD